MTRRLNKALNGLIREFIWLIKGSKRLGESLYHLSNAGQSLNNAKFAFHFFIEGGNVSMLKIEGPDLLSVSCATCYIVSFINL